MTIDLKDLVGAGASLRALPDGSWRAEIDRLEVRGARIALAFGQGVAARTTLQGAVLRVGHGPGSPSFSLLGLQAAEVAVEGVELAPSARPGGLAPGGWRFDALAGLDGSLHVHIPDAAWVVDADITVPLVAGRLDFDAVVVEHVGPNSSMGISRNSIYLDAPNSMGRTDLYRFTAPSVPGAVFESRGGGRVTDRGSIDVGAFLAAMLSAPSDQPFGGLAGPQVGTMLDRTTLSGELRLGDGALGSEQHHVLLSGRGEGRNRITLNATVLGQRLVVRLPALQASGAAFALFGQAGRCGALTANVELQLLDLGRRVEATVHRLGVEEVAVGVVDLA